MIAYDIYLKTSFELLLKERIRSYLFLKSRSETGTPAGELFESTKVAPLGTTLEEPPDFPQEWLNKESEKDQIKTKAKKAQASALDLYDKARQEQIDWEEHYGPQKVFKNPRGVEEKDLVKQEFKDEAKELLTPETAYFEDFLHGANHVAGELDDKFINDEIARKRFTSKIYITENYDHLKDQIWNDDYYNDPARTQTWKNKVGTKQRRCNLHYHATKFKLDYAAKGPLTKRFGRSNGRTLKDWTKQAMENSTDFFSGEPKQLQKFVDYVQKKCKALKDEADKDATTLKEDYDLKTKHLVYVAHLYKLGLESGFLSSLYRATDLTNLYYYAAFSLIETLPEKELSREEMLQRGKEKLKEIFSQVYTEVSSLFTNEQTPLGEDLDEDDLRDYDDMIDFSLFSLINEMDK